MVVARDRGRAASEAARFLNIIDVFEAGLVVWMQRLTVDVWRKCSITLGGPPEQMTSKLDNVLRCLETPIYRCQMGLHVWPHT